VIDTTDTYRWAIVGCLVSSAIGLVLLLDLPARPDGRLERAADALG
jgi:hypothetical protein